MQIKEDQIASEVISSCPNGRQENLEWTELLKTKFLSHGLYVMSNAEREHSIVSRVISLCASFCLAKLGNAFGDSNHSNVVLLRSLKWALLCIMYHLQAFTC